MELEYIHSLCKKTSFFSLRLPGYTSQTGLSEKSSFTTVNYGFYDFASLKNEAFFIRDRLFLQVLHTSEGRIRVSDDSYTFDYYLKDHLGNTRVVVSDDGTVQQASNYYPFGMRWNNANTINNQTTDYLYNGKEIQEELGWYDYGARFYDAAIGRTTMQDPLAETFYSESPYSFIGNNPIINTDPTGMSYSPYYDENGDFLGVDENGFAGQIKVTSAEAYKNSEKNADGSVNSESIGENSDTKNIQDANLSDESIANVYTDVVSKISDSRISSAKLYNGSISVYNNTYNGVKAGGYNNPEYASGASHTNFGSEGYRITMNKNAVNYLNTVENAQNTLGAHEILGHGISGIGGDESGQHHKVYEIQMSHSTWGKTTNSYKSRVVKKYLDLLYRENPSKYNTAPTLKLYKQYGN